MGKSVFVSYSHAQAGFVQRDLVPVLRAAGCGEVIIDRERFIAGRSLIGQMDAEQDRADVSLLLLTDSYLASANCLHELRRAVASDPGFLLGRVVPVRLEKCALPPELQTAAGVLRVELLDRTQPPAWASLLAALDATALGTDAPHWLGARAACERQLLANRPVNLLVRGGANWRALLASLAEDCALRLPTVDLSDGATVSREGLVGEILHALGTPATVPAKPNDLAVFSRQLRHGGPHRLVLRHCHFARERFDEYGADLFRTLRHLMDETRTLVPLFQSREPLAALLSAVLPAECRDSLLRAELVEL